MEPVCLKLTPRPTVESAVTLEEPRIGWQELNGHNWDFATPDQILKCISHNFSLNSMVLPFFPWVGGIL